MEGMDIAALSLYCDETGGDYFDFLEFSQDDATHADIAVVAVAKGTVRLLAATEASENAPCFSPDGSLVAYVATATPGFYSPLPESW